MGSNKDKDAVRRQAEAQERMAATSENLATKYAGQSDADRAFQKQIFEMVRPLGTSLMAGGGYEDIARPDISGQIKRNYAGNLADIQEGVNKDIGASEDYATSMGMGRSGLRGMGFGAAVRGGDIARGQARQAMQEGLTGEDLARYQDAIARRGLDIGTKMQGANILTGQQAVFNPVATASLAGSSLAGGVGARSAAGGGFYNASQMPSTWSKILSAAGGVAGAALGGGGMFGSTGAFGQGGFFGAKKMQPQPFAA